MHVSLFTWAITIVVLLALIAVDFFITRKPHEVSFREAASWSLFWIGLAIVFGLGLWYFAGGTWAGQFFAGYVTEKSLSVDNLFVFLIIMTRFAVPTVHRQRVLMIGVLIALVLRAVFILLGAAVIAQFSWVFYLFGAFLVFTAINLVRHSDEQEEFKENALLRWARRVLPTTDEHDGELIRRIDGKRYVTPMLIVMIAIGTTDLLFALDSIPAIFGLTKEPYLVFAANAFALMGLRQLYFLVGGLLDRLVYLSYGLAVILGFIGIKLIVEAMAGSGVTAIAGVHIPHISTSVSLSVIAAVLVVTTVASLIRVRSSGGEAVAPSADSGVPVATEVVPLETGSR